MTTPVDAKTKSKRLALRLALLVVVMLGLSRAAVPLYQTFCQVTGFGGTTQVAEADAQAPVATNEIVRVRFDGTVAKDMPWRFEPAQREMSLRIGETGLAYFHAKNTSDETITGTASFNVTPLKIGGYFVKIDCFCFTEQTLKPGESVDMPVTFYVDPEILDNPETARIRDITLSYTFYRTETPKTAAVAAEPAKSATGLN